MTGPAEGGNRIIIRFLGECFAHGNHVGGPSEIAGQITTQFHTSLSKFGRRSANLSDKASASDRPSRSAKVVEPLPDISVASALWALKNS